MEGFRDSAAITHSKTKVAGGVVKRRYYAAPSVASNWGKRVGVGHDGSVFLP